MDTLDLAADGAAPKSTVVDAIPSFVLALLEMPANVAAADSERLSASGEEIEGLKFTAIEPALGSTTLAGQTTITTLQTKS